MLDASQFITRNAIEDFSLQFVNEQKVFVADMLFVPKVVKNRQTKKYQYDTSMIRAVETRASSKTEAMKVDYGVFTENVTLEEHKLKHDIDPRDEEDFDRPVADLRLDAATNIMQRLLIKRELLATTLATTSSNYNSTLYTSLTNKWTDPLGDPESDAIVAQNAVQLSCGRLPNAVTMSGANLRTLRTSPAFRDRIKFTNGGPVPLDAIKAYFGVEHIFASDAVYDTSIEGEAATNARIWTSGNVVFHVYDPSPALRAVSFGHQYIRNQLYSFEAPDNKRGGSAGRIQELEMGWEYVMDKGFVDTSAANKFAAGYLYANAF